jgi:hypothetical protein
MIRMKLSQIKDIERFFSSNYKNYIFDTSNKDTFLIYKKTKEILVVIEHKRMTTKTLQWLSIINS